MDQQIEDVILDFIEERNKMKKIKKQASKKVREARKKLKEIDSNIMDIIDEAPDELPVEVDGFVLRVEDKPHVRLKKPTSDHRSDFVSNAIKQDWTDYLDVYTTEMKKGYPDQFTDVEIELIEGDLNIYTTDELKIVEVN